jgi:hypothetical protein
VGSREYFSSSVAFATNSQPAWNLVRHFALFAALAHAIVASVRDKRVAPAVNKRRANRMAMASVV